MTDLKTWKSRATDCDPITAAEVWADPAAPVAVLRDPPTAVLEHLLGDGAWQGTLSAVLRNPALPTSVLATLAARAKGEARATISRHALRTDVARLVAAAPAITAAQLGKAIDDLRHGWENRQDPNAAQARLVTVLRAFTTSSNTRCRALAAQAFPLTLGPRHRYAQGEVSASKLVTDPEIAVLVALARNHHLRDLPESEEGLAVRRALLGHPTPRVRAAARRAGVHVLDSHVLAALEAADGHPVAADPAASGVELADPLDDPAPSVRVTAVAAGIPTTTVPVGHASSPTRARRCVRPPPHTDSSHPPSSGPGSPPTPTQRCAQRWPVPDGPPPNCNADCFPTRTRKSPRQPRPRTRCPDRYGCLPRFPSMGTSCCQSASPTISGSVASISPR